MPRNAPRATARNPNRSDLTTPSPVTTVPGQEYGQAAQQRMAQGVVPMGPQPVAQPSPGAAPPASTDPNAMAAAIAAHTAAGRGINPGGIARPTERPNEPVTHGLPAGPGGGPEVLSGIGGAARDGAVDSQGTLGNLLSSMTNTPGVTTSIVDLAQRLQSGHA